MKVLNGLIIVFSISVITILSYRFTHPVQYPPPVRTVTSYDSQHMRGLGFTAEDTKDAIRVASEADPALGTPSDVLFRMGFMATTGLVDDMQLRSLGITPANEAKELKFLNASESEIPTMFRVIRSDDRLKTLIAMMEK